MSEHPAEIFLVQRISREPDIFLPNDGRTEKQL
jgi:hypothetical protein